MRAAYTALMWTAGAMALAGAAWDALGAQDRGATALLALACAFVAAMALLLRALLDLELSGLPWWRRRRRRGTAGGKRPSYRGRAARMAKTRR